MPTYEYECPDCDHAFEAFQRMSDDPIRVCPECGKRKVRRLISKGGGLVFKGSGFYATDYRAAPPVKSTDDDQGPPRSKKKKKKKEAGETGPKAGEQKTASADD